MEHFTLEFVVSCAHFDLEALLTRTLSGYAHMPFWGETNFLQPVRKRTVTPKVTVAAEPDQLEAAQDHQEEDEEEDDDDDVDVEVVEVMESDEREPGDFGPDNAMTLADCKALSAALLSIAALGKVASFRETLSSLHGKLESGQYEDVQTYLAQLQSFWEEALKRHAAGSVAHRLAKKYKALCLGKFELLYKTAITRSDFLATRGYGTLCVHVFG